MVGASFDNLNGTSDPNSGPYCEDIASSSEVPFTCHCRDMALYQAKDPNNLVPTSFLGVDLNTAAGSPFDYLDYVQDGYQGTFCSTVICFPSAAIVYDETGSPKRMDQLHLGDKIRCLDDDNSITNCIVHSYLTITTGGKQREYHQLTTSDGSVISMSGAHIIFVSSDPSFTSGTSLPSGTYKNANKVIVGEMLVTYDAVLQQYTARSVTATMSNVLLPGAYAPTLMTSDRRPIARFFVDDFVVSTQIGPSCSGMLEKINACAYWDAPSFLYFSSASVGYGAPVDDLPGLWWGGIDGNSPYVAKRLVHRRSEAIKGNVWDPISFKTAVLQYIAQLGTGVLTYDDILTMYKASFVPGSRKQVNDQLASRA